jgi:hypothetical protein
MTNIAGRLKKSEDTLRQLAPFKEDIPMFFVRFGYNFEGPPGEDELKFLTGKPDYKGQIYHVWIGSRST